jgi:hypothetical protein
MDWSPVRTRWNSIYRKLLVTYVALTALGTSILAIYILWSFYRLFYEVEAGGFGCLEYRAQRECG